MLPAILAVVGVFAVGLCGTSPVYNMQPAFITTNIGTTGRNIRNLPCISRKNNQSGVCMFAIDCLKANGTHLGTCIDRFYFGSCCHIEPVNDIIENTIDDIIPSREPPHRLSSTIKPITTTPGILQKKKNVTLSTTTTRISSTQEAEEDTTTVSYKLTTFQSIDGSIPAETTFKPTTTTQKSTVGTTTIKPKPTKVTKVPIKTTIVTKKPAKITTKRPPTTTTRRSTFTTTKPRRTTTYLTTTTTRKPVTTRVTITKRPTSTTTNRIITRKPVTTIKPSKRPTSTTPATTKLTTTIKPSTVTSTTTTESISTNLTEVLKPVNGNVATNEIDSVPSTSTQKPSTTTKSSVVTWTIVDGTTSKTKATAKPQISTTVSPSSSSSTSSTANGTAWQPITTPDGWVLLPSVPPSSTGTPSSSVATQQNTTASPVTAKPVEAPKVNATTSTTPSPTVTTTQNSTTITTSTSSPKPGVTTEVDAEVRPVNMSDFTDVCGRRMYPEARIVGGEKSSFGKWPWQISLRQWRTSTYLHKCGAALLNENWAITAAHCVDNVPPSDLLLRLGEHDLSTESEPYLHQERRVQIVASHPQFDPRTFEYDLALLRFYEPVTFQPNILPVCVPQTDENFVGRTAYVTGWGRLYEDGPLPSVLQEVSVPVINNSVCESMYRSAGYIEHIPHIFICAGWRRGGFDSCEGDSGGPMVIQRNDKRFLLAGVISWGIGCAEPNQPGVYTRISEFRDWINQILQF